jgi:hypothetical protein
VSQLYFFPERPPSASSARSMIARSAFVIVAG